MSGPRTVTPAPAPWDEIAAIHAAIPDFGDAPDAAHFAARCAGRDSLALAAHDADGAATGYLVAYDRYGDGSFYCWMAGVVPAARRGGVLTALMAALEDTARARGYGAIRIKTRERWAAMRRWLAAHDYTITAVDKRVPLADSRVHLIKILRDP